MAMSDVKNKLSEIQNFIQKMTKDRSYRKANKFMEWKNKYSSEIVKCAGELEVCRQSLSVIITDVAKNIRLGISEARDVSLQEMELENATIGYLSVDDAAFALQSVENYDAINSIFEMINMATKRLYGGSPKANQRTLFRHPERDDFKKQMEEDEVQASRVAIYREIKDDLITTGRIEECMKKYRQNKRKQQEVRRVSGKTAEEYDALESPAVPQTVSEDDVSERRAKIDMDKNMAFNSAPPEI